MNMYVHAIYIYIYIYIHVHVHTCTYTFMISWKCLNMYIHVCTMFRHVCTIFPNPVQVVRIPDDPMISDMSDRHWHGHYHDDIVQCLCRRTISYVLTVQYCTTLAVTVWNFRKALSCFSSIWICVIVHQVPTGIRLATTTMFDFRLATTTMFKPWVDLIHIAATPAIQHSWVGTALWEATSAPQRGWRIPGGTTGHQGWSWRVHF